MRALCSAIALARPATLARIGLSLLLLMSVLSCSGSDDGPPDDAGAGGVDTAPDVPSFRDAVSPRIDVATDGKQPGDDAREDAGSDVSHRPFGGSCRSNDDCESGWCVGWDEGYTCTMTCFSSESCPDGWECRSVFGTHPDVVFLCHPADSHICQPCATDYECGSGACIELGAEQHCTRSCGSARPCPDGYECTEIVREDTGLTSQQCVPISGSCDCGPLNVGRERSCTLQNEFGACWGAETCREEGWSDCSANDPAAETCNGLDDDCNGFVDEDVPEPTAACRNEEPGVGACDGAWVCRGPEGWVCTAATPVAESCNYQDDDCDGAVDEDFLDENGAYAHVNHCGVCGRSCEGALPHATERCDLSGDEARCVVAECDPGYVRVGDFACVLPTGGPCVPCEIDDHCLPTGGRCVEMIDGLHCARVCTPGDEVGADCGDGYTCTETEHGDEIVHLCQPDNGTCTCTPANHGDERSCVAENELGRCFGVEVCDGSDGWIACDAPTPGAEVCNGGDDDCDGFADEGVEPPAEPCRTTWQDPGTGELAVCAGDWVCGAEGGVTEWRCFARQAGPEACDYQDNDCDGAIDEDFKTDEGKYGSDEHCGACGNTCVGAIPNATAVCDGSRTNPICVVDTCAAGYYRVSETSCAPVTDSTCTPCATDASCPVPGDRCLDLDGARYCARDCGPDNAFGTPEGECGAGYACVADTDGGGGQHCAPVSGSCTCHQEDDAGHTRSCIRANAIGTCTGLQTCVPETGWDACSAREPAEESCNGADDDCDGQIDEDVVAPVAPCEQENEFGLCGGAWRCAEGAGGEVDWVCDARAPAAEICDRQDNDCDGATDEDFRDADTGVYDGYDNCGLCGYSCEGAVLFAEETACEEGAGSARCVVVSCQDGYFRPEGLSSVCVPVGGVTDCSPCGEDAHCEGLPGVCVALDGGRFCARTCSVGGDCAAGFDCVGGHCEPTSGSCTCLEANDGASRPCFRANPAGTCSGSQQCTAGVGWSACTAREPALETCNGQDDDCNGLADEGIAPPEEACEETNEHGTCGGAWVCEKVDDTTDWHCAAPAPAAEACNYRDDDCDGQTDEAFRDEATGRYDDVANCGVCGYSCEGLIPHAVMACDASRQTPTCVVADCDEGYFRQGDYACLPVTTNVCQMCETDDDCPVPGDRCLTIDGARFCGYDCSSGNLHETAAGACPGGYECVQDPLEPALRQCRPASGSCTCVAPADDGATRLCVQANTSGTCFGQQQCDPDFGWSACDAAVPAAETCNGVDDDCDTLVDEGVTPPDTPCANENANGRCVGAWVCRGEEQWQCNAQVPAVDSCDYVDNDCDSTVDEDFRDSATGAYVHDDHCGACGVGCGGRIPNASATCRLHAGVPRCEVLECDDGFYQAGDLTCLPVVDSSCTPCANDANCPVPGDRCLDLDGASFCGRDCAAGNLHGTPAGQCPSGYECADVDGVPGARQCVPASGSCTCLAEHANATRTCVRANAYGTCYGSETCNPASGWSGCSARTPAGETCNGVDDDCNGQADDVAGLGEACEVTATLPNGPHACDGLRVCRPGSAALVCNAPTPAVEACNYLDDDCDGATDETFTDLYDSCSAGRGACERYGFKDCRPDGVGTRCNAVAGDEGVEVCNGFDDDCDGSTDEGWPTKNQACTVGNGVCTRNGVYTCNTANPAGPVVCNAQQGTGSAEVCDLLDNDCDGTTDEGWLVAGKYAQDDACGNCFTNCTQIYAKEDAWGRCNATGTPACEMVCCKVGSTNARCDRQFDYFDLNQVPDDGCEFQLDPDAIYVSETDAQANDLAGCGRGPVGTGGGNRPCKSIAAGLQEAQGAGRHKLIVADGLYEETVTVVAGIDLLGGHRADTWERHLSSTVTVVRGAQTTTHKKTIIASSVSVATVVEGFVIYGPSNYATGGNSYAVYIQNAPRLTLRNNIIWAGRGGPGGRGSDGGDGSDGANGAAGLAAVELGVNGNGCTSANHRAGGSGGQRTCGGTTIYGGVGGTAVCPDYDQQDNPLEGCPADGTRQTTQTVERGANGWGAAGCPSGAGCGGAAGYDQYVDQYVGPYGGGCGQANNCCNPHEYNCSICNYVGSLPLAGADGTPGGSGGNGGGGSGGTGAGSISGGDWRGAGGQTGAAGVHGQGGGGGGAAGGVETWYCTGFASGNYGTDLGGSGGGGGSGGCGATGGGPGSAGGGAFAVFVYFTSTPSQLPTITGNRIHTGIGGAGGDGGAGGVGGAGGSGATGGAEGTGATNSCALRGGSGGSGGRGGHGGGGGGGAGGVSYGLFAWGQGTANLSSWKSANTVSLDGAGGPGGAGGISIGTPGSSGSAGASGIANF